MVDEYKLGFPNQTLYKEVNILCNFAYRLASLFHSYYNECKVIDETNSELTTERLALVKAIKITLENALNLLGIEVKEDMYNLLKNWS